MELVTFLFDLVFPQTIWCTSFVNDFRVWGGKDEALCKIDTSKLFSYVTTCSTVTKPLKFKVSIFPFDLLTQFISGTGKRRGNFIDILKIAVVSQTRHHIIKMEKRGVDFSWSQGKTVTKNLQPNLRIFSSSSNRKSIKRQIGGSRKSNYLSCSKWNC